MPVLHRLRSERGLSSVEYAIIVAGISLVIVIAAALAGHRVTGSLCQTTKALGGTEQCATSAPSTAAASSSPGASAPAPGGAPIGGGAAGTGSSGAASSPGGSETGNTSGAGVNPGNAATGASNSPGTQVFNTALIDQDGNINDLSMRVNVGWFPNSWSNVSYPTSMTVDVTWSPALAVDQVITGNDGAWSWKQVSDGHIVLTRSGSFDTSGFQPEPEILLAKPATSQVVSATFTAAAPNTPSITKTASTTSVPYK